MKRMDDGTTFASSGVLYLLTEYGAVRRMQILESVTFRLMAFAASALSAFHGGSGYGSALPVVLLSIALVALWLLSARSLERRRKELEEIVTDVVAEDSRDSGEKALAEWNLREWRHGTWSRLRWEPILWLILITGLEALGLMQ